jgi:Copper amine oxidase N-terminal domain.
MLFEIFITTISAASINNFAPDNLQVSISRYSDSFLYNTIDFCYGNSKYTESGEPVNLLMVNGSFVNCGNIFITDGTTYVPAQIFYDTIKAEYVCTGSICTVKYKNIHIKYNLGSDEIDIKTGDNESTRKISKQPMINNGEVFIPVRFYAELLEFNVYFNQKLYGNHIIVNTIIVDDNIHDKIYSTDEGYDIIHDAAKKMYLGIVKNIENNMEQNHFPDEALEKVKSDAGTFEIVYTDLVYGRYYIYHIKNFVDYNIYLDKYTGDIFSDAVYVLPFMCIRSGVVDLTQIYWYDWDKLN